MTDNIKTLPLKKISACKYRIHLENADMHQMKLGLIKKHGQTNPVIVRQTENGKYECVSGAQTLCCLKELRYKEATCYDLGKIPLPEALIAALKIELVQFENDDVALSTLLVDLLKHYPIEYLYEHIPLSRRKIDCLIELKTYDWEKETAEEERKRQVRMVKKADRIMKDQCQTPSSKTTKEVDFTSQTWANLFR